MAIDPPSNTRAPHGVRRAFCSLRALALASAFLLGAPAFASAPPWPEAPYTHNANNQRLDAVLAEFASGFGLSLAITPDMGSALVNGRFTVKSPTEFMSRLAGVYGFVWYTHAGTLFISRASDVTTRSVAAPGGAVGAGGLRKALTELGVFEQRFGWGELSDQGVALVSGPATYVNLIESTLRSLPVRSQHLGVFRLQHASAEDRTVMYRDKEITTPGLASTLRELLSGQGRGGAGNASLNVLAAPLRSAPAFGGENASPGLTTGNNPSAATAVPVGRTASTVSIQSDPRLNAIIVQDSAERMPIYQKLIEQLDVPTAQIEIEAMIIDINTERARELGVNWAARTANAAAGFGAIGDAANGTLSIIRGSGADATTMAIPVGNYLLSQIRLLESQGDAQIQSRPSVLTTENLGALLDLSETFYIRTVGERVANVTPITAGTTLRVTPRTLRNGDRQLVELKIDIEDGQIQDRQIGALPTVRRSTVNTQAIVMQGEALLIAGYSSDQNIISDQKVPVLGDIPGLGALFSNKTRVNQKRERMFLIRPKVVAYSSPVPAGMDKAALPVTNH
jgi:type III secretion protein C